MDFQLRCQLCKDAINKCICNARQEQLLIFGCLIGHDNTGVAFFKFTWKCANILLDINQDIINKIKGYLRNTIEQQIKFAFNFEFQPPKSLQVVYDYFKYLYFEKIIYGKPYFDNYQQIKHSNVMKSLQHLLRPDPAIMVIPIYVNGFLSQDQQQIPCFKVKFVENLNIELYCLQILQKLQK